MRTSFSRYLKDKKGVAAIETAFILPILLLLYIGMVDITELVSANRKMTQATAVIADVVSKSRNEIKRSDIKDSFVAIDLIMRTNGEVGIETAAIVSAYRKGSSGVSKIWSEKWSSGDGANCTTNFSLASLDDLFIQDTSKLPTVEYNDVVVAEVCKMFTPFVGHIIGSSVFGQGEKVKAIGAASVMMEEIIRVRPRVSNKVDCYDVDGGGNRIACPPAS
jgi:Flp pilus assembly protein TadG